MQTALKYNNKTVIVKTNALRVPGTAQYFLQCFHMIYIS